MESCPFCRIEPTRILLEDDHALVSEDPDPVSPGHLLAVTDLVSKGATAAKPIALAQNAPGFLVALDRREIVAPQDRDLWPGVAYLHAHRSRFRL